MTRPALLALALLLLTGCAESVADFRSRPVTRDATVAGDYRPLASCLMEAIDNSRDMAGAMYRHADYEHSQSASILAHGGLYNAVPLLEVQLAQEGEVVRITSRSRLPFGRTLEDRAWRLLDGCAAKLAQGS